MPFFEYSIWDLVCNIEKCLQFELLFWLVQRWVGAGAGSGNPPAGAPEFPEPEPCWAPAGAPELRPELEMSPTRAQNSPGKKRIANTTGHVSSSALSCLKSLICIHLHIMSFKRASSSSIQQNLSKNCAADPYHPDQAVLSISESDDEPETPTKQFPPTKKINVSSEDGMNAFITIKSTFLPTNEFYLW
jgi:hypothetical protein